MKKIEDYDNELEIVIGELKAEYADCGSHSLRITFDITREELKNFLKTFDVKALLKEIENDKKLDAILDEV